MTSTFEFVSELASQDIKLRLDGEQLRVNAPGGTLSPLLLDQLKARKPDIIEFLRQHQTVHGVTVIERVDRGTSIPLSFSQERLWFLSQLDETNPSYNIPAALRLCGPLDVDALSASWKDIEARHEILRTTFPQADGRANQQINEPSFQMKLVDFTSLSEAEQAREVARLGLCEATQTFDLVSGPLWRVTLASLSHLEYILFVTMHHIISDGWSIGVLTRELSTLYAKHSQGNVEGLPELPIQYADFAIWQRKWLTGPLLEQQLAYWRKQLADTPPLLNLPLDRPRPRVQSFRGAKLAVSLPQPLTDALYKLSQRFGATLFMTLQAGFSVLLSRYSGQTDVCIGTPIANRQSTEIETLAGFFINTLVLRNDLSGDPTFRDFLSRVRQVILDAQEHQALPFELIVEALRPERTLAHATLFQVMFVLQNIRQEALSFGNLSITHVEMESATAKFDLTLTVHEIERTLSAVWQYNTDLFDRSTIERMAGQFQTLLAGIVADPDQCIARLPLLSEAERHQLLFEWNSPETMRAAEERSVCIHHLFEEQVARTPHSIAVVFGDQELSYSELNARANHLAHQLRQLGVGPDRPVGLFVERSLHMVTGVFAVLKAGGAYLPLDPDLPVERLKLMLEDAQAEVLVTQQHLLSRLSTIGLQLVFLDQESAHHEMEEQPLGDVQSNHLAYVLYTSGSTGIPKGVAVEHQQLVSYCRGVVERFQFEPEMRYAMLQALTVDFSVTMFFCSLITGGTLYLIDREIVLQPGALAATIQRESIDCLKITPSHLAALIASSEEPKALLPRKRLLLGGEAFHWKWVQQLVSMGPCKIYNHYGPTETTVGVLTLSIEPDPGGERYQMTPLGRPLPKTQIYILDPFLQPVPVGCSGELYVGGASVSRGYLNRPALNAERFLINPFGEGRLYKTGDWVRRLPDGAIDFLGRMDGQVKVRGFRIELGEIEAQLRSHPQVREAFVSARDKGDGQKQLVAYVVAHEAATKFDLHEYLKKKLPDYMMPGAFAMLTSLPRIANGKVDRLALAAIPLNSEPAEDADRQLPRTQTEEILAGIWRDVLGLDHVGVTDNFFHVGGDSILSIQIVSRARQAGLLLTPKNLFEHQTIAELGQMVRPISSLAGEQGLVTGSVPLTPIQRLFFSREWNEPHHFNQSLLLKMRANINPDFVNEAVRALLIQHDALRMRFERIDGQWQQKNVGLPEASPFQVIDLSALPFNELESALENRANALQLSLNLANGPLARVALFHTGTVDRLLIVIHHLVVDGISWRILLEDLQQAYSQLAVGDAVNLPSKTTSFRAWASLLETKGPSVAAAEREHWTKLSALDPVSVPVDHVIGQNDNASAAFISTSLSVIETQALLNTAPAAYHTQINDLLLTALVLAFQTWTGQKHLLIDLEGHGREEIFPEDVDFSRTVGWFTAMFPVGLATESTAPGVVIKAIKEQLRRIPNRGIGYGILRYLQAASGQNITTISPEVSFNYLGQFDQSLHGPIITGIAEQSGGISRSQNGSRGHLLEITGIVAGGELRFEWVYSRNYHRAQSIEKLANSFMGSLRTLLVHCLESTAGGYTPSDFPETELSQIELDGLLARVAKDNASVAEASGAEVEAIYPLSPSQQGMLLECLAVPSSGLHVEQSAVTWRGPLNVDALVRSWQAVVDRNDLLRTGFAWEGLNEPLQYVLRKASLPVERHSLQDFSPVEHDERVERYLADDRKLGFNLRRAPLMRLAVFALQDDLHRIVWTRHHILMDGWSRANVAREFMSLYRSECSGERLELQPSRPYKHYISWLRKQSLTETESFWRRQLAEFTAPTPIATKMASGDEAKEYAAAHAILSSSATAALGAMARQSKVTTNTLVQACWGVLLHHYSRDTEVLFGATVSGRPPEIPQVESMVGLFINSVPVRIELSPVERATVSEWLGTIQDRSTAQQPHSYVSAGQIHQWSDVPDSLPLYESLLVFENYPVRETNSQAEEPFELVDAKSIGAQTKYALTVMVLPGAELHLHAVYDATRFASHDVHALLAHLVALLERISAAAEQPLQDYIRCDSAMPQVYPPSMQRVTVPFAPPRTETELRLTQIWQTALGIPSIGVNDSFFNLGGHSLVALRLMAEIQKGFNVSLPLATLLQHPTIAQLAKRLSGVSAVPEMNYITLVPLRSSGLKTPLFVVPGAGGNVLYLHDLMRGMSSDQPFYGLQSVGLDGEIAPHSTVEAIAAHNVRTIQSVSTNGPYLLAGHSFGGKIIFEMARQLLEAGEQVSRLLILDATAPTLRPPSKRAGWDHAQWALDLVRVFCEMLGETNLITYADLKGIDPERQLLRVKAEFERLHVMPAEASVNTVRGLFNVLKNNRSVTYAPTAVLPTKITLFRAGENLVPSVDTDQEETRLRMAPDFGWSAFSEMPVDVVSVPGDHLTMITRPHVAELARQMQTCLDETTGTIEYSNRLSRPHTAGL